MAQGGIVRAVMFAFYVVLFLLVPFTSERTLAQQDVIEKAKQEGEVVVWAHTFDGADEFVKGFNKIHPYLKVKIWDGRTEEVVNKVITEAKAGKFSPDVVILSTRGYPEIHKAGILQKYPWPEQTKRWPNQPAHGFWKITAASLRLPSYNTNLVRPADVPKSWEDLKSPRWAGKSVISSSGADAPLLFADLWKKPNGNLDWERSFGFWSEVIKTAKPKTIRGFTAGFDAIASGEVSIFLLSSVNSAVLFMERGAPIKMAPVGRTMGSTWGIGIPKTIPHPNGTKLFVDYLLSEEGLLSYVNKAKVVALDPAVVERADANVAMKQLGVEWYPIDDETRSDQDVTRATRWWTTELGMRRGKADRKKKQ